MRPKSPADLLKRASTQAFLVTDLTNIRYLTGLHLTAGVLLVLPKRFVLFVDSRYTQAAERAAGNVFTVSDSATLTDSLKKIRSIGFEADKVTMDRFGLWKKKFKSTKFVHHTDVVEHFRRGKTEEELAILKKAERITEELLRRVPLALKKGITEEELARKITIWALELGAEGMSFDPIVGFGTHTSSPHHRPTKRTLKKGHLVQIDIGAKYRGYCADRSEVFFTAKPSPILKKVYETLCLARDAAMEKAVPGASTHLLDRTAREVLKREGIEYAFTHALGHGVGLDIHEGVSISSKGKDEKLVRGEVITIEPGVYFPGKFGMRVESMVYVD